MKLITALLLVGSIALGADPIVKFEGKASKVGKVEGVSPEAKVTTPDGEVTLKVSGAGIRQKVKVFTFDVYSIASYVGDVDALRKAKTPVEGVEKQKVKVLRLTMLRGLSASEIQDSFEASLDVNGVDLKSDGVKSVFKQWSADVVAGDTITLIGYPEKDTDTLIIEVSGKKTNVVIKSSQKGLPNDFWKIWFGKGDAKILELQPQLVGN